MARSIKVKRNTQIDIPEDIEGCRMVSLNNGKTHWTKIQNNVLPNTYYRVNVGDEESLRAMVTIMPDGLKVAWDTCGKCKTHVKHCHCPSGAYPSASIGWIRATYDINYPTERVVDYSMYNDPYKRLSGGGLDIRKEGVVRKPTDSKQYVPVKRSSQIDIPISKGNEKELTVKEIENLDFAKLGKEATKQANRTVRRTRSVIKGGKR